MSEEKDIRGEQAVRAALKEAGAPLLSAAPGFAAAVAAGVSARGRALPVAFAAAALAAAAALLVFLPARRETPAGSPGRAALTEKFENPYGASVPGDAAATQLLYRLSARALEGPGTGPAPSNLKEGL
jgi:hypothetical protein